MAGEDKTEQATPQRLREARKRGDLPVSPEMTSAVLLVIMVFTMQQQGAHLAGGLMALLSSDLAATAGAPSLTAATVSAHLRSDAISGLLLLVPLAVTALVAALVAGALNTRGYVSLRGIVPSFRKLNPAHNAKNLVGKEAAILLIKAVAKLALAVVIVQGWVPAWQALLPSLPYMSATGAATTLWQDALQLSLQIAAVFLAIGAADFGYRQFSWRRRLRMTKQEVKDEVRQSEGDVQMRARMRGQARRRLRALLNGGGIRRVPQADVVITNPTHFAIAIQYQAGKMRAPKVIAKGQRLMALRIKEAAKQHNIPIVENKPLAQALFKAVDVNKEIPPDLYQAVAQVLAFVYRMKAPAGTRRTQPTPVRG